VTTVPAPAWQPPANGSLEVVGPPGAGKSALAAALAGHGAQVRLVKDYRSARHLPLLLSSGLAVAPIILRDPVGRSLSPQQLTWVARLESSARILDRHRSRDTVIVFDQGPIYTLARLSGVTARTQADGPLAHWRQAKIRQWTRLLDLIVVLDAPDPVLLHRIGSRGKTHALKQMPVQTALAALARDRAAYTDVVGALRTDHGPRLLRFDSSRSQLPEMVTAILTALDTQARARRLPQHR
jgi:hypothetical protein